MRGVGIISVAVSMLVAGCFRPALEQDVVEDAGDVGDASDVDVAEGDGASDTPSEVGAGEVDAADSGAPDTPLADADIGDTGHDTDVAPSCSLDSDCASLSQAPCVVGRCVERRCNAVNVVVPCDDGDVCTTADQCDQGVCRGRAFTAEEARSWIHRLGGGGIQHVTGLVSHPSGHVTVVGTFDEEVSFGGQQVLTTSGGFDGFVVRLSARGELVNASRFGDPERDEVPLFVAGDAELIGAVWASAPSDSSGPVELHYRTATNTAISAGHGRIAGQVVAVDALPGGDLLIAAIVGGAAEIALANGGTTTFTDATGSKTYIARLEPRGASWAVLANPVVADSYETGRLHHSVVAADNRAFVSLTSRDGASLGAVQLERLGRSGMVRHRLTVDPVSGGLLEQEIDTLAPADPEVVASFVSRVERDNVVDTIAFAAPGNGATVHGVKRDTRVCSFTLQDRLARFAALGRTHMVGLIATNQQALDLGGGVLLAAGPHLTALATFDSACAPMALSALALPAIWDSPSRVRELGAGGLSKAIEGGTGSRVFIGLPVRGFFEPGGPFGAFSLTADGFNDSVIGSLGPADLYRCGADSR